MNNSHKFDAQNYYTLLTEYINICNEALKKNKNNFPFKSMWEAIEDKCQNQEINISLIDDYPNPICSLSVSEEGVILSPAKEKETKSDCHIKLSHIKHVLNHKEDYIKDPAKIDWHWIEAMIEHYKSPQG